jgi:hypothetical protein
MKIINAYLSGWKFLRHHRKMWLLLYLMQFVIALLAALPLAGYLGQTVGHSLDLTNSLGRFDYTFLNDLWLNFGGGLRPMFQQTLSAIAFYFFLSAFLTGGILTMIKSWQEGNQLTGFFAGAGHFFWRVLRLGFYFLIPQLLLLLLMGTLFLKMTNNMFPFELESELEIIRAAKLLLPIYLILATILFMIHDLAKIVLLHRDETWLTQTIRESFRLAFRHFFTFFPLYLLNVLAVVALTVIYYLLKQSITQIALWQVVIGFLLGQLYLFLRVGMKVVNLGALEALYSSR